MNRPMELREKVRILANITRTFVYAFEQLTMGSENWRINQNLRSAVESVNRYMEQNPDEPMEVK